MNVLDNVNHTLEDMPIEFKYELVITGGELSILVQEWPNDADLGRVVRKIYEGSKKQTQELEKEMD